MNINADFENLVKILVIGDFNVGKTNFILQFADEQFIENAMSTVGFDLKSKVIKVGSENIKIQVWDTAGQERYQSISKGLFQKVQGIIIVYDITNYSSFENISNWIHSINDKCGTMPVLIVGNKIDKEDEREVGTEEGKKFANDRGLLFCEVSAKTGKNIKEAFTLLVKNIIQGGQSFNEGMSLNDSKMSYIEEEKGHCCGK